MQFQSTYNCLANQLNYHSHNMKYSTWSHKPSDTKAAYLFLNFFPAINSAWYKKKTFAFIDEAEAVSLVLQYLSKNVAKIDKDKKRYTSSYIYTVCVNCMSILHWRKCDRARNELEISSIVVHDGKEFDIFSVIVSRCEESYNKPEFEFSCCSLEQYVHVMLGIKYEKLLYHMADPTNVLLRKTRKTNENYHANPFSDIGISKNEVQSMKEVLKECVTDYIYRYRPDLISYVEKDRLK